MADHPSDSAPAHQKNNFDAADFDRVKEMLHHQGVARVLQDLSVTFRKRQLYPQLFEILKLQCRLELEIPLVYDAASEKLDEIKQYRLEQGLLAACQEVGLLLWKQGELEKGWMYLQPVGNRAEIVEGLEQFPIHDDNLDAVIDIAIGQGLTPAYGYQLLMQKYGTCNAITTFDMQANRFDRATQKQLAELLLRHVYRELVGNLLHSLRDGETPESVTQSTNELALTDLLQRHPQLSASYGHKIDATHLASVVRIAKLVSEPEDLKKACELTKYGRDLHSDFQYPGTPPFEDSYRDHQFWYQAQLGIEVEKSIAHFQQKCMSVDVEQCGAIAFEWLSELLFRLGRRTEAIEVLVKDVWGKFAPLGVAPNLFQIAQTADEQALLQRFFQDRMDLLSYSLSLLMESQTDKQP